MKIDLNKTRVIDCSHQIRPTARAAVVFRFSIYRSVRTQALSWQGERSQINFEYVAFQKHQNSYYGVVRCIIRNTSNKDFITNIFSFPLLILTKLPNRY